MRGKYDQTLDKISDKPARKNKNKCIMGLFTLHRVTNKAHKYRKYKDCGSRHVGNLMTCAVRPSPS